MEATGMQRMRSDELADRVEQRLAIPVVLAALASIPAVFLTMLDGSAAQVGNALNWMSLAVLTGESVVLFLLAGDRVRWLRRHRAVVAIAVVTIPAVVFAVGPVQVLRLVRFVGALRVIRVHRILKAGRILRRRAHIEQVWLNRAATGATVLAALFVAVVLADPTSESRRLVEGAAGRFGTTRVLLAGVILGAATFVALRYRRRDDDSD